MLEEGGGAEPDEEEDDVGAGGAIRLGVNVAGDWDSRSSTAPLSAANVDCAPSRGVIGASTMFPTSATQGTRSLKNFSGSDGSASGPDVRGTYAGLPTIEPFRTGLMQSWSEKT